MKTKTILIAALVSIFTTLSPAFAKDYATSTTAAGGYDVVSYHSQSKAMRGSGNFVSNYKGETYLFSTESNKKKFDADPARYAPAYGGYCAYGVAVGKKFVGDPELWKIVNKTLYLNLNKDIQNTWKKDIPGNIAKAETNWSHIQDKSPASL